MIIYVYLKLIGPRINADLLPDLPEIGKVKTYRDGSADNVNVNLPAEDLAPFTELDHHLDWLLKYQPALYKAGAQKTIIYYTYWANSQGNTEFSTEQLRKMVTLGADLAVTCASLEEE